MIRHWYIKHDDVIYYGYQPRCSAKPKSQYLLTCKVRRYCLLAFHDSTVKLKQVDLHHNVMHLVTSCSYCISGSGGETELSLFNNVHIIYHLYTVYVFKITYILPLISQSTPYLVILRLQIKMTSSWIYNVYKLLYIILNSCMWLTGPCRGRLDLFLVNQSW